MNAHGLFRLSYSYKCVQEVSVGIDKGVVVGDSDFANRCNA